MKRLRNLHRRSLAARSLGKSCLSLYPAAGLLLEVSVVARPTVLAPFRRCARSGPSTPHPAEGPTARKLAR